MTQNEYMREYREKHKHDEEYHAKRRKYAKKYNDNNKAKISAAYFKRKAEGKVRKTSEMEWYNSPQRKEYESRYRADPTNRARQKRNVREWGLKTKYGISSKEYDVMVDEQSGLCAICQKPSDKSLYVDHNHVTGEIRGLLCQEM